MKRFYTIGETARLLGVSTQTLRYYDKIGGYPDCAGGCEADWRKKKQHR